MALARRLEVAGKLSDASLCRVPLTVVVDAKDVHDKGRIMRSQKSQAFTVAWMRSALRRPGVCLRWTATENMFVDAGTKDMDLKHLRQVMTSSKWCVTYAPDFVKQVTTAAKKVPVRASSSSPSASSLLGRCGL